MRIVVGRLSKFSVPIFLITNGVALFLMIRSHNNPSLVFSIFSMLGIIYLSWAFLHHFLDKSLTLEVMIEYVLTAALALVILYSLLV